MVKGDKGRKTNRWNKSGKGGMNKRLPDKWDGTNVREEITTGKQIKWEKQKVNDKEIWVKGRKIEKQMELM